MPQRPSDSLHAMLHEAEAELTRRLQEACEAEEKGVVTESAAEIRKLEDTLFSAALAAERAIAARRLIRANAQEKEPPADPSPDTTANRNTASGTSVRQFEDKHGRTWRAWPVTPDVTSTRTASRRSLGDFQDGWICFEALDESGRRRLPKRGKRWSDLRAEELAELLEEAMAVPARKSTQQDIRSRTDTRKLS